jgi:hypothetical protein
VTRTPAERVRDRLGPLVGTRAQRIADRDLDACTAMVNILRSVWDGATEGSCCKPHRDGDTPMPPACVHLTRLWAARDYESLARANAPQDVWACRCDGTGIFSWMAAGVLRHGKCFGCEGKGYQTAADRKRNEVYWNHYARVGA